MNQIQFIELTDEAIERAEQWAKEDLFFIYEPYDYNKLRTAGDGTRLALYHAFREYGPTVDGQEACSAFPRDIGEALYYAKNNSFPCIIAVRKKTL